MSCIHHCRDMNCNVVVEKYDLCKHTLIHPLEDAPYYSALEVKFLTTSRHFVSILSIVKAVIPYKCGIQGFTGVLTAVGLYRLLLA